MHKNAIPIQFAKANSPAIPADIRRPRSVKKVEYLNERILVTEITARIYTNPLKPPINSRSGLGFWPWDPPLVFVIDKKEKKRRSAKDSANPISGIGLNSICFTHLILA